MKLDVHRIVTTLFNVELNPFIAKVEASYDLEKVVEIVQTGGLMVIEIKTDNVLSYYAYFLKSFRDDLFSKCANWLLPIDSFCAELQPLLQFYIDTETLANSNYFLCYTPQEREMLKKQFSEPLSRFFYSLDSSLSTNYFKDKIGEIKRDSPELTIKIVNAFNFPIPNLQVDISSLVAPQFGDYSKIIPFGKLMTGNLGIAQIKLTRGHYIIKVPKYNTKTTVSLQANTEIEFKVFDVVHLLKHLLKMD